RRAHSRAARGGAGARHPSRQPPSLRRRLRAGARRGRTARRGARAMTGRRFDAVVERLRACRVIPVATLDDPAAAGEVGAALLAGGISCLEITFRRPGAAEAIRAARASGDILVGAGTVLSLEQADAAAAAGADFAVAPGTNEAVVRHCSELG